MGWKEGWMDGGREKWRDACLSTGMEGWQEGCGWRSGAKVGISHNSETWDLMAKPRPHNAPPKPPIPGLPSPSTCPPGSQGPLLTCFPPYIVATAQDGGDKVIEGYPCQPNSQPWQAYLQGSTFCGGVLLNRHWVLTPAHCKMAGVLDTAWFLCVHMCMHACVYTHVWVCPCHPVLHASLSPYARAQLVRLGVHNRRLPSLMEQRHRVIKTIVHPNYNPQTYNNDIMLMRLQRPVVVTKSVQPVALPRACPRAGQSCLVSGWGTTHSPGAIYPNILQCAQLQILSNEFCRKAYGAWFTPNMMCAGIPGRRVDSCQGDSGGPLTCGRVLQGIVSWGPPVCGRPNEPGVYTRVCNYLSWIRDIINGN
ncbi:trypsin-like [Alligator sinensis]|uniref:Trypsin-like n=1 Tax=Alligator sinensis TaxID=38654 RepID=A0A3Q0GCU1_ALLSI|nr:trypsin-like [Alligator sinensis]